MHFLSGLRDWLPRLGGEQPGVRALLCRPEIQAAAVTVLNPPGCFTFVIMHICKVCPLYLGFIEVVARWFLHAGQVCVSACAQTLNWSPGCGQQ